MLRFVAPLVFCLAGVAADYAADPYRNKAYSNQLQNTHNVEAGQMDASSAKTDHSGQNKESPFGNAKSAQNENIKALSNDKINNKYGISSNTNAPQPRLSYVSVPNSPKQYDTPKSGFGQFPNAASQVNVSNEANTPYQTNAIAGNPTGVNGVKGNQFDYPENLPNQFQRQKQVVVENLNAAYQYKKLQTPNEANEHFGDDQQYGSLDANYDDTRLLNKRQDSKTKRKNEYNGNKFMENCHIANHIKDHDEESSRAQEPYKFNNKLNEDFEKESRKYHQKDNLGVNGVYTNSQNADKDQPYQSEFEGNSYSPPSRTRIYYNKGTKNREPHKVKTQFSTLNQDLESAKPTNFNDDFDEKAQITFSENFKQQLFQPKIKEYAEADEKPRKFQKVNSQTDHENYDEKEDQNNLNVKNNKQAKSSQTANNNSQTSKQNKNFPHSQVPQKSESSENVADVDSPDEYETDEDYIEDYKGDFSDLQSRRSYNLPQAMNNPQSAIKNNQDLKDPDCDSNEAPNQLAQDQNYQNREAEEVDVTAKSGRRQKVLIGEHTRVCYACSSTSNPSCLKPSKQTTVKYCHRGHDSCITKVFKANGIDIITRDCGTSCNDNIIPGITPKYAKCSVCHSDLCNGAFSLNGQNVFFICALVAATVTKYFV